MGKLVLKKYVDGIYFHNESSSEGISYLGEFLCQDVCTNINFFRKWLADPNRIETGGNYSHVEKHGDRITIEFELNHFEDVPNAPIFELTVAQMKYILDRWEEAIKKQPNRIIITKDDNGEITVDFEN